MTGYLEVTREPAKLELLPGASGRIDYVVTNKTGQKDYVRVVIPTKTRFTVSVVGESEVMVDNNATTSFALEVAVKADAAPGDESLELTFVAARDSDKFSATAPATQVVVNPKTAPALPTPVNKPFPWWIVAVVGGVLVVGAILLVVFWPRAHAAGEACNKDSDCQGGLSCLSPGGGEDGATANSDSTAASGDKTKSGKGAKTLCLKPLAAQCERDNQCATGYCKLPPETEGARESGACAEHVAPGGACATTEECRAGECKTGKCLLGLAAECQSDVECESGLCSASAANTPKQCRALPAFGEACAGGRRCGPTLSCGPAGLDVCLYDNEQPCQLAQGCASLFCNAGKCGPAPAVGAPCLNSQCGFGEVCERNTCLKPTGAGCAAPAQCASGKCSNKVCDPFGGLNDVCTSNEQCSGGLQCYSSKCLSVDGGQCAAHSDCMSNHCDKANKRCLKELRAGDRCDPNASPCAYGLLCNKDSVCEKSRFVWTEILTFQPKYYDIAVKKRSP